MSEAWGPRAHPERCNEEWEARQPGVTWLGLGAILVVAWAMKGLDRILRWRGFWDIW